MVGGTCAGITPSSLSAGATALSFSGITIPGTGAGGSCTITFVVTSNVIGSHPNTTSGVTTTQTPNAGSPSNMATLVVHLLVNLKGDFDGDGKTDLGVWRPSTATFFIYSPAHRQRDDQAVGVSTDVPVVGRLRWGWEDGLGRLAPLDRDMDHRPKLDRGDGELAMGQLNRHSSAGRL